MVPLRRLALVALAGMVLAGCGGGGMSSVTPGPSSQNTASATRAPRISTQQASPVLYVANVGEIDVYPLDATSGATPVRKIPAPSGDTFEGVATAPTGELAVLVNFFDQSQNEYCKTLIYPADADANTLPPAGHLCDPTTTTQGEGIARGANGFDVLYRQAYNGIGNSSFAVERLDGTGTITSTLVLPAGAWGSINTNGTGRDYVGEVGTVNKYDIGSTNGATPMRSFSLPSGYYPWAIAVSDTVYIAAGHTGQLSGEVIYAYGGGASSPTRTIGPFVGNYITAMATDRNGLLYVALNPISGYPSLPRVRVFSPTANGTDAPLRVITNAVPYGEVRGLAVYQP
jgi:hypothetical protein